MKILITTQYMENYAAHDWDGIGECPQGWKMKGGEDFIISVEDFRLVPFSSSLDMLVDSLREKIEYSNNFSKEYIIGYDLVEDDFQTESEKSQLEYDGEIFYPAKRLAYDQLMEFADRDCVNEALDI